MEVKQSDPLSVINTLCLGEFNGIQEMRFDLVKLSQEEKKRLNLGSMNHVVFWDSAPIFVVSTFTIIGADVNHDSATVNVLFDVILNAKGEGNGNRVFVKKCAKEKVKYNLIKTNGKWFISDPPKPVVSIEMIIKYYKYEVKSTPKNIWDKEKYSEQQRAYFKKFGNDLNFLKNIYNNADYCK